VLQTRLPTLLMTCWISLCQLIRVDMEHLPPQHTHTQPFYGSLDFVQDNQGEPIPEETFTHSHSSSSSIIPICFLHLLRSMASCLFNARALQSFSTIYLQVFFGLPPGLAPSTSYFIHFFTQSSSSFRNACPYHRNLFCCSTEIMSSSPRLCLNSLLGILSCNWIFTAMKMIYRVWHNFFINVTGFDQICETVCISKEKLSFLGRKFLLKIIIVHLYTTVFSMSRITILANIGLFILILCFPR